MNLIACSSRCQLSRVFEDLSDSKMPSEALLKVGLFLSHTLLVQSCHLANNTYKSRLVLANSEGQNVNVLIWT